MVSGTKTDMQGNVVASKTQKNKPTQMATLQLTNIAKIYTGEKTGWLTNAAGGSGNPQE